MRQNRDRKGLDIVRDHEFSALDSSIGLTGPHEGQQCTGRRTETDLFRITGRLAKAHHVSHDSLRYMAAAAERCVAKLKQQDQSIWEKIRDYITELAKKIRKAYEKLTPDSEEGRIVAQMGDKLAQIQEMFADALLAEDTRLAKDTNEDEE